MAVDDEESCDSVLDVVVPGAVNEEDEAEEGKVGDDDVELDDDDARYSWTGADDAGVAEE